MSDNEITSSGSIGIGNRAFDKSNIAFYLPPFFVESSPIRRYVGDHGGVLQTPFFEADGTTSDPFNLSMAFGVNGHYINLENFTKDFTTGRFPRLFGLTGSTINSTTQAIEANIFLYQNNGIAKRNLTVLPCDDGQFDPNYEILSSEKKKNKFIANEVTDYSYIDLSNMISGTAALSAAGIGQLDPGNSSTDFFLTDLVGPSPEIPGYVTGSRFKKAVEEINSALKQLESDADFDAGIQFGIPLTIFQRTLDPSSNQVTIFNISNLYYGRRIQPGTFTIKDSAISGSHDSISITLKDDSLGNIYRADSYTPHHTQNSVGNIFYDEGIILIKSPHLYFFGKNQYEISFKGVYNVFTTKYEVLADHGLLNSSSNPTFAANADKIKPSGNPVDNETFIYISGLNFHDENMNLVAKARLAQPVIKREGDKILFKVAFDW